MGEHIPVARVGCARTGDVPESEDIAGLRSSRSGVVLRPGDVPDIARGSGGNQDDLVIHLVILPGKSPGSVYGQCGGACGDVGSSHREHGGLGGGHYQERFPDALSCRGGNRAGKAGHDRAGSGDVARDCRGGCLDAGFAELLERTDVTPLTGALGGGGGSAGQDRGCSVIAVSPAPADIGRDGEVRRARDELAQVLEAPVGYVDVVGYTNTPSAITPLYWLCGCAAGRHDSPTASI